MAEGWTVDADVALRLLLAVLLGGAVGLEREFRGRPAGLRTHILVCLGATVIMISSTHLAALPPAFASVSEVQVDPGRIAAGIVTGIGFLGAGAILRVGSVVHGLTTAGCIWFVAALGIALGQGMYALASVATVAALAILLLPTHVDERIQPVVYRSVVVLADLPHAAAIEARCRRLLEEREIQVLDMSASLSRPQGKGEIVFRVRTRHAFQSGDVLRQIAELQGVIEARWA